MSWSYLCSFFRFQVHPASAGGVTYHQRIMFIVSSTLQLVLASALVLLGVSGNLAIPFISYRSTLRCPHITVLAVLDFTATLLGPGLSLVTLVTGLLWWEHNKTLCQSLTFLNFWVQFACFLVLFVLALFCQNIDHHFPLYGKLHVKKRGILFLVISLLTGLLFSIPPILGWSSYNGLYLLNPCSLLSHVHNLSYYTIIYLVSSLIVLFITLSLTVRAIRRRRRFYPLQLFWERHKLETMINDPEMTTTASSSKSSSKTSFSRRSSVISGRLSGVVSSCNSPLPFRKTTQRSRSIEGNLNVLLEIIARERTLSVQARNVGESSTATEVSEQVIPSATTGRSLSGIPGKPFVISSQIPHPMWTGRKRIFHNPRSLPPFKGIKQQKSFCRLLLLRCCLSILCWLPLCTSVALSLCFTTYPQQLNTLIKFAIYLHSSISPLLPLFDASYRMICRRAAIFCFKPCARKNDTHVDLSRSRDVDPRNDGGQDVRLQDMIRLEGSKL